MSNKVQICEICVKNPSKYCCPKCNIVYCSLDCYKSEKHLRCSEQFYKAAVIEELKDQNVDASAKTDMIRILQNFTETSEFIDPLADEEILDSDDEPEEDLAERLKGVDLNDGDALWEKLTNDEQQQFQNLIDSGEIIDFLPKMEPWYMKEEGFVMPVIVKKIPEYNKISSKPPAISVKYNLINILSAYSYMQRYFLGDNRSFQQEACSCLCNLSGSLRQNNEFVDLETAVKAIFIEGMSNQFEVDPEMEPRVVEDVKIILQERSSVLACLSDILSLFKNVEKGPKMKDGKFSKRFQDDFVPETIDKTYRSKIIKRIEYFLAYVNFYFDSEIKGCV